MACAGDGGENSIGGAASASTQDAENTWNHLRPPTFFPFLLGLVFCPSTRQGISFDLQDGLVTLRGLHQD